MPQPQPSQNENTPQPLALVTGAAHRLGKIFALCLARLGFGIALHYHRSSNEVDQTVEEIQACGVPVYPVQADLRNEADIQKVFSFIGGLEGKTGSDNKILKVLVNSAAVMNRADGKNIPLKEFDETMSLNLRAPFFCAQLAYLRMLQGGLIVNISDIAAQKAWKGYPAYTISKAGLDSLTKVLAVSFAPKVRVNGIAPGLTLPGDGFPQDEWSRLVKRLPSQRQANPDELGSALEFLLKNEYITGQTIVVDGGYSLL
jgi:pteridine reductase